MISPEILTMPHWIGLIILVIEQENTPESLSGEGERKTGWHGVFLFE